MGPSEGLVLPPFGPSYFDRPRKSFEVQRSDSGLTGLIGLGEDVPLGRRRSGSSTAGTP